MTSCFALFDNFLALFAFEIFECVDEGFEFVFAEGVEYEIVGEGIEEEFDVVVGLGVDGGFEVAGEFLGGGKDVVESLGIVCIL